MAITNRLKRLVHKKQWEMVDPIPFTTGAGSFFIKDPLGLKKTGLLVGSATVQYLYYHEEDAHVQIPSMALAGTFGAGACGAWTRRSNLLTATSGDQTKMTVTVAGAVINNLGIGKKVRFRTGANIGIDVEISDIIPAKTAGGVNTIYFKTPLPNAVSNGDTFKVTSGLYYILNAYTTLAAGVFKSYDPLTGVVNSLATSGLPASWGTDGRLVATPSYVGSYSSGNVLSATTTTLKASGKTWAVDQWKNTYQVRITEGTGIGQTRPITANLADGTLTIGLAWATVPDATSKFVIEANDDQLILVGNNAITAYKYIPSTTTWSTITPTVARGGAFATGGGANWIAKTGNSVWADETNIQDGRFIVSFRGGGSAVVDIFDMVTLAWSVFAFTNNGETFTTGSSYDIDGSRLYARKDSANRFFYLDVVGAELIPFSRNLTSDGAGVVGDKLWTSAYVDPVTGDTLTWLYTLANSGTLLYRMLVI